MVPKQSSGIITGSPQVFPVIKTEEIDIDKSSKAALVHHEFNNSRIVLKALPSTLSLAPIVKKNNQDEPPK